MFSLCAFTSWRQRYCIACANDNYNYITVFPFNSQRPQRAFKSSKTLVGSDYIQQNIIWSTQMKKGTKAATRPGPLKGTNNICTIYSILICTI